MVAEEVEQGLRRLGVMADHTLPYSPHQNGKQESFWGHLEGRLMAMLEGVEDLTLEFLNRATQAWVEMEYNRSVHSETGQAPIDRFAGGPDVTRPSPEIDTLRFAFRQQTSRSHRRSDGTVSIEGVRFEIPGRFRQLQRVAIQYARWDLRCVHLVDERDGSLIEAIYPLDKAKNADSRRRVLPAAAETPEEPESEKPESGDELPPLLEEILQKHSAMGVPPAYLPKTSPKGKEDSR